MNAILDSRAVRGRRIFTNPEAFRICLGCESIVKRRVNICPNCKSFRFCDHPLAIMFWAKALGGREANSVLPEDLVA